MKTNDRVEFGNLHGLRVINASSVVAGPFLCELLAEQGADVIQIESTRVADMYRMYPESWSQERANQRSISLNIPTPEGKEVLGRLLRNADILVESSRGGTWTDWGLDDDVLWAFNPALVIVHISGFGQDGDLSYLKRASFDSIGQAFSGYMAINGFPDPLPPYVTKPFMGDFVTGLFGAWAALAGYIHAKETGKGESIDMAQFEALARIQGAYMSDGINFGKQAERMGNLDTVGACKGTQRCADGWIFIAVGGAKPIAKMVEFFGLQDDPDFEGPIQSITRDKPDRARKFNEKLEGYCATRTVAEVEKVLGALGVALSPIMTYKDLLANSHYQARHMFQEWQDLSSGKTVRGVRPVPRFIRNPSKIVRSGAPYDYDTKDVLGEVGFTPEEINSLYNKGILRARS
ncbi:MAG: CoA transferase [Ancrocorticia sp.]|jgi:L-carnitine CoA-transferase|nr:CoA transferase [Ancrocorticia sp.]MCI1896639.1 CoA transferase [Ancrocorticia sp.]MCI1933279.1 CoA transferase [Ancrocorticia sp.]MCI1963138.1 CoA transferase [Ancrocorticia sp.]MCI2001506.1 CoA transferase [Ancrocorticia sp.]